MNGYLRVDPDELMNVRNMMDKDGDDFDKEIDKQLALIEKLRECWEGIDAETFCNKYHNYLMKMKTLPQNMKEISNAVRDINIQYQENDAEFADKMEKEALNYVEDKFENN